MIKFISTNEATGRRTLGMIITDDNIKNMREDKPIHFHVEQMPGLSKIECEEVLIVYYKTMEDAMKDMKDNNMIDEDTVIRETSKH
jgi:hypothetical protein